MKRLKSKQLEVNIDAKSLTVSVKNLHTGFEWKMQNSGPGDIGIKGHCGPWQGFSFKDANLIKWEESDNRLVATLTGWSYSANVWSPITSGLVVDFTLKNNDLRISLAEHLPIKHEASIIDSFYPRGFLFPEKTDGDLVLPIGEGCLLNKNFKEKLDITLPGWIGLGFVMPWWGQISETGEGFIATTHTPDDIAFRINTDEKNGQTVHPYWQASLGGLKYSRNITYSFFEKTSVVKLAKAYRKHADIRGQGITLKQKITDREKVKDLRGAIKLSIWMMSDFENFEQPGRVVYIKFKEAMRRYKYLIKKTGIEKAIVHIDGWCKGGYDFNHPDVLPPDERLGGWQGLKELCDNVKAMGHRFTLHDNYVDYYAHVEAFKDNGGVLDLSGIHSESDEWLGGRQRWLCSTQAKQYTERNFNEMQKNMDFDGIYPDCWTVGPLRECFDQNHPATRTITKDAWSEVFANCQNRDWLVGSEGGNDWAVPVIDYCWGVHVGVVPHALKGKIQEFGTPIPLYSLVWHDAIVAYGWITETQDNAVIMEGAVANNKHNQSLWAMLRGNAPTVRPDCLDYPTMGSNDDLDKGAEFIKSLKPIIALHEVIGFEEMVDWELLDNAGAIQKSIFANGTEVTVNFEQKSYQVKHPEHDIITGEFS